MHFNVNRPQVAFASQTDCAHFPFECAEEFHRSFQREFASGGEEIGRRGGKDIRCSRLYERGYRRNPVR